MTQDMNDKIMKQNINNIRKQSLFAIRLVVTLLLMMVVGVNGVWGQDSLLII